MRRALVALSAAAFLTAVPLTPAQAGTTAVTTSAQASAEVEPDDGAGGGDYGDWGLAGLAGLFGLFGYKKYRDSRAAQTPAPAPAPVVDDGLDDKGSGAHRI